jgi:hypothetical protein
VPEFAPMQTHDAESPHAATVVAFPARVARRT